MSKRKRYKKRHYNVEMIQDFLEHLRWVYAVNHFENTHKDSINPELVDQLEKYTRKYNTVGLMDEFFLTTNNMSEEQKDQAMEKLRSMRAKQAKEVLQALDTLEPYLEKAFNCALHPYTIMQTEIEIDPLLNDKEEDE